MAATQKPIKAEIFGDKAQDSAWKKIPSWYLVAVTTRHASRSATSTTILIAFAGSLGEGCQRAAIKAIKAALTNSRTVVKALKLGARLNGELGSSRPFR